MTVDKAKHKMDFLKKAYQKLIDEKVDSGKLVGDGVMGEWKAETPLDEAYKDMIEALDLAIKALEQQPCEDAISRAEALRIAKSYYHAEYVVDKIRQLPSVTPKPSEDCRNCKKWNECLCGKEGHENGTSIGYSIGECKEYEPCEDCISREAVLDKFAEVSNTSKRPYHDMWEYVEKMSPVTPKTEPCEDYIKRADVLKYAQLIRDDEGIVHEMVHVDDIKDASSVTWSGWTPATQLPEPSTAVLLHVKYKSSGQWTYQLGMWNDNKQAWEDWRTPYQLEEEFEVIAWMELPEKYEEDNDEW